MITPTGHTFGLVAAAAFAMLAAGCYYGPTYRSDYDSYGYRHYVPYTSLHIGIFSGSHGHHDGYGKSDWRGVPYRHYKGDRVRSERHYYGAKRGGRHARGGGYHRNRHRH